MEEAARERNGCVAGGGVSVALGRVNCTSFGVRDGRGGKYKRRWKNMGPPMSTGLINIYFVCLYGGFSRNA